MKKFILRVLMVLLPVILMNVLFGILRYQNGDNSISFKKNLRKQYLTIRGNPKVGFLQSNSQQFDLSRESRDYQMIRYTDTFGFQNVTEIKNPKLLFIGDSFFDDPFLSFDKGLSYNFSESMNISSFDCSGFRVFNELKERGFFDEFPKCIFIEIVERDLDNWGTLWSQIEKNEFKSIPYNYFGLDFVLGNNFLGANMSNLGLVSHSSIQKNSVPRRIDERDVYFCNNRIHPFKSKKIDNIIANMKLVSQYFKDNDCQVVFIVAPDKESIFPELFPSSNLPLVQKQFAAAQIQFIDMYSAIMQSSKRKVCYFDGDTHWNENAYDILRSEIGRRLDSLNISFALSNKSNQ